ncbi:GNAT family N-acetyltransferase [Lacisediminihabitans changchengi]|uniref:GNAT family N-acetyltransferase n=1 Tax=Lacisediminihabitans changchengi TaxID=2787634 RepID=A0A934W3S4_9MICO|nr:GNAT family N-acetyltransferase [Lacisediminihabitans changchengi]MBK4347539.1 GNAT family N-acetyltransferase [Lacisediminihabitans changchengi]
MFIGLRPLEPRDDAAVLRILEARPQYLTLTAGAATPAADVRNRFYSVPDGATEGQKRLFVIESDHEVAGVLDAVLDYPELGAASIGMFAIDPTSSLRGHGVPVAALVVERAVAEGITTVHAGCPSGWLPGERLLWTLGFAPVEGEGEPSNPVLRPHAGGTGIRRWVGELTHRVTV